MDSTTELISIGPLELKFQFMLNKLCSCSFQLSNKSDKPVAFRVKTTDLKRYSVEPKNGIILRGSQSTVTVTMQPWKKYPLDLSCSDMFLVQSVAAPLGPTLKVIPSEMFNKDTGNHVEECQLEVSYVYPDFDEEEEEEEEKTSEITSVITTDVSSGSSDHQFTSTKEEGPRRNYSSGDYYVLLIVLLLGVLLGHYI